MNTLVKSVKYGIRLIGSGSITLICAFILLWLFNEMTGVFTYMHLEHEREMSQQIHDPQMVQELLQDLVDDTNSIFIWKRRIAAIELGRLGEKARSTLPVLEKLKTDKDYQVRMVTKEAIKNIQQSSER